MSVRRTVAQWPFGLVAVLLTVAAVYAPTVNDYFGGDDFLVIGPVSEMGAWELIGKSVILRDNIPYWRPLVAPLYALEVHGFWLRPWAYHLVALGLHLANVALVVLVARALTGRAGVALAAGLLFGIHAAHTTTVAQISSTVELLSVVWYLATVYCAVQWVHSERGTRKVERGTRGIPWYALSLLAFCSALLTKESTASAAAVITVLCFLFVFLRGGDWRRFVAAVAPFWAVVIPYIAFTFITDRDDPTGIIQHMYFVGGHIGQNMWWFLARLAAPFELGQGPHVSRAGHIGAALLLVAGALVLLRGSMPARLLVLWTVIALTPLAPWRPDLVLGRFTYQASIPFAMLLALGGGWLAGHLRPALPRAVPGWAPGVAMLLIAVAVYAPLTISQNRDRTREGETYRVLVEGLRREFPTAPPGTEIVLVDGVWPGPFHARYLQAVADTLYGAGRARIVNAEPGASLEGTGANRLRLRFRDGVLTRME